MKTLQSMMRISALGSVVAVGLCLTQQAQAATGICRALNGTQQYSFPFNQVFTDPAVNVTGKIIENAAGNNWSGGPTYPVTCDCPSPPFMSESYISASSPLMPGTTPINGMQSYILNDYLAVAAEVWVAGANPAYVAVPFQNRSNGLTGNTGQECAKWNYGSGSQGKITLYFRRPFVGTQVIPSTTLVNVFISSINGVSSPTPAATVSMSGTVTVPQSCDINPQAITINFGDIMSTAFQKAGQKPDNFNKVNQKLTLACRNISDGVKIDLSFQGTPDGNDNTALKTTNDDIAVKIEDASGNVISPNNGRLPVNMNYTGQVDSSGVTEMNLYPINTTGKMPAVGVFNSTATVRVEIQ
ncbi:type 1 fimbria pilin [Serratia fonticola]|uniref:Type 1 fimbria pilin n=1 Tax=Serratia fonticola TaxID=47917 RepID=A0A542CYV2_SERFO|nr:fimbrial protein [Serratia fonticola]TQI81986.1 type 1 fimbria pilin [Serratia fonticola]TQI95991.1 type 1 fimbria pilin [Serratia fonticola]TVZ70488.1 type 1 fimbria pilin [Serratia fonticola]